MSEEKQDVKRNSYGLFDAPVRSQSLPEARLSLAAVTAQMEAGAFVMTEEEALEAGFLSPYDRQDACKLNVGG